MATVRDNWDAIELITDYVQNSLIIKPGAYDDRGIVLKWLESNAGLGDRKEKFLATDPADATKNPMDRTVLSEIMVNNPQ